MLIAKETKPKQRTKNKEQGTKNKEQGTKNQEPRTTNKEPRTTNNKQIINKKCQPGSPLMR
jgi:hypothetical protein